MTPAPDSRETGFYFALAQVGLEMVAPMLFGLLLDYGFGWMPWATVIGFGLGTVGGMIHLILMVREHDAEKRRRPRGGAAE